MAKAAMREPALLTNIPDTFRTLRDVFILFLEKWGGEYADCIPESGLLQFLLAKKEGGCVVVLSRQLKLTGGEKLVGLANAASLTNVVMEGLNWLSAWPAGSNLSVIFAPWLTSRSANSLSNCPSFHPLKTAKNNFN
jgi:hypothetical protein